VASLAEEDGKFLMLEGFVGEEEVVVVVPPPQREGVAAAL
jgi:hypothetical protein